MVARDNVRGLVAMMIAVGSLSLMDACLKLLSPHYPPAEIASLRGLSTLPIVLVWVGVTTGYASLLRVRFGLHLIRGSIGIGMLVGFTYGVRHLPLADAYTIFFVAPILITILAGPLLGERVDRRRWIAIVIGFVGVLIVLRPARVGSVTLAGSVVLLAAVGYALSAITVRVLGRTDSTQSMVFWTMTIIGVGAGMLALPVWRPIQPEHWPIIGAMAVTGALGQWAITEAFRRGEASFIAPFEYTALAWGVALDWLLWKTTPAGATLAGAAVIIGSGVYLLRHERVHVEAERP